jgi:hypothetical protein
VLRPFPHAGQCSMETLALRQTAGEFSPISSHDSPCDTAPQLDDSTVGTARGTSVFSDTDRLLKIQDKASAEKDWPRASTVSPCRSMQQAGGEYSIL